jgi:hypothetical protein
MRVAVVGTAVAAALVAIGFAALATTDPLTGARGDSHRQPASALAAGDAVRLDANGLSSHVIEMLDLDAATVRAGGSFSTGDGGSHEVYLARNGQGEWCLVEERVFGKLGGTKVDGIFGGGCSPGALRASDLKVSVSARGDPDAPGTQGVSIVGIAGSSVRGVRVTLGNGQTRVVPLTAGNGFHYSVPAGDVGRLTAPRSFQAVDVEGRVIHRVSVG